MKKVSLYLLTIALLSGCYSLRTNPSQPLSEATFGEKVQRRLFFAHDCRANPECQPICIRYKKAMEHSKAFRAYA